MGKGYNNLSGKLSDRIKQFPGKSNPKNTGEWLPTWIHMIDTAEIMKHLLRKWIPDSVKNILQDIGDEEELTKCCVFLAMVHDIGKFTPLFCSKILPVLPYIKDKLDEYGIYIDNNKTFIDRKESPHAIAGAVLLQRFGCSEDIIAIVGAHHGKTITRNVENDLEDQLDFYSKNYFSTLENGTENFELWMEIYKEWFEFALQYSGYCTIHEIPEIKMTSQMLLTGLLIMADWLASNNFYFPLIPLESMGNDVDIHLRSKNAWKKIDLPGFWHVNPFSFDAETFYWKFGFEPNAVQKMMIQAVEETVSPGIFILEAQMGVGKTEAALAASELLASKKGCGGLFFGLPTQATANGLFPRMYSWAETQTDECKLSLRLAHGMAALNEEYRSLFQGNSYIEEDSEENRLVVHSWFEGRKQALLANFVIGTVDQFLMAALKQKHVMLRHLGMAGKIIIIDECHAYDAYMSVYLDQALKWAGQYGIPVIILSATLPPKRRSELIDAYLNNEKKSKNFGEQWRGNKGYPLLTWTDGKAVEQNTLDISMKNRNVEIENLDEEKIESYLEDKLSEGGCAGIIVNTVKKAQETYERMKRKFRDKRIILFHSRFLATDRSDKESILISLLGKKATTEQRDNLIIIGTQVLEQSLDIDFDILLTELCPMDLLLQRIGRLHRHGFRNPSRPLKMQNAVCAILNLRKNEFDDGSKGIYGEWLLAKTQELISESIEIPMSIPELVNLAYENPVLENLDEMQKKYWNKYLVKQKEKEKNAKVFRISKPRNRGNINGLLDVDIKVDDQSAEAAVRDGENTLSVICLVEYSEDEVGLVPWQGAKRNFSFNHVPCEADCIEIAKQKINLPLVVTKNINKVINELEIIMNDNFAEWQQSAWISGELILLLDPNMKARLSGYMLQYDQEIGLIVEKEGE